MKPRSFTGAHTPLAVLIAALWVLAAGVGPADGKTRTWVGGGNNGNWSMAGNWDDGSPASGDSLVFDGQLRLSNTNNRVGYSFNGITFASGANAFTLGGNAFTLTGDIVNESSYAQTLNMPITLSGARIVNTGQYGIYLGGVVSGDGSLNKDGSGTLCITADDKYDDTYKGETTISAGTLQIGNGGATGWITGDVTNNAALVFNRSDTVTFGGIISSNGSVTQQGPGTLILTGNNTYSGWTTISAGTLQIGNGGTAGWIAGNVTNNAALTFNRSDTVTFGGIISGNGSVTQQGPGTRIFTGDNTYTGGTTISAGTLQIGNGGTTGWITGNVTDNANLTFNRSDTVTFGGSIGGSGSLTQQGPGTLALTGTNSYIGGTNINGGVLSLGSAGALGTSGTINFGEGTLQFTSANTTDYSPRFSTAGGQAHQIDIDGPAVTVIFATPSHSSGGSLTKSGAGTLVVTANNSYDGGTMISAGTLQIGNGGATGGITGDVTNNAALVFNRSDTVTFGGIISSNGSVTQQGPGTLIFTGNNTYTGGTTISAGALQIGNGGATGWITGNVTDNAALTFDRSDTVTFGGSISGSGSLTQQGPGTLALTGTNSYIGGTNINGGVLSLGSAGALGTSGTISFGGGALQFTSANTTDYSPRFSTAGGQAHQIDIDGPAVTVIFATPLTSSGGSLTKSGAGTLVLTANNSYDGGTTISAGTLQIGNGGATGWITGNVTNNAALVFNRSGPVTFGGSISGGGSVTQQGPGTLLLTGTNTYTGGTTISGGYVAVGSSSAFGTGLLSLGTATIVPVGTGDVTVANPVSLDGDPTFGDGSGSLTFTGPITLTGARYLHGVGPTTFTGTISGAYKLTKYGTGTLVLTGENTFAKAPYIEQGILQIGDGGTHGSIQGSIDVGSLGSVTFNRSDTVTFARWIVGTGSATHQGTGTLILTGYASLNGGLDVLNGALQVGNGGTTGEIGHGVSNHTRIVFNRSDTATCHAWISGNGSVTQQGPGTLILTNNNTYTGGTTVSGGTLQLGNGGNLLGSVTGNILNNERVVFIRSDTVTFGGTISGSGEVVQQGTGTVILAADNTYTGGTTVSEGTLVIGSGGTTGWITGNTANWGHLAFCRSDTITYGGTITGDGSVTQAGTGTLVLTGTNSYTGGTILFSGVLSLGVGSSGALGTSGTISFESGILQFTGANTTDYSPRFSTAPDQVHSIDVDGPAVTVTFATPLTSSFDRLRKYGSGTLVLTANNTYEGTVIVAGVLRIGNATTTGMITGYVRNNGGLIFHRSDDATFSGAIDGTGRTTKWGGGTLILTGNNTYSGGTFIDAGTLQVGNGGTGGSILGNVENNGGLIFYRSDDVTFGGSISGSGSVTKQGAGTLTFSGANGYTGGTVIVSGTLALGAGGSIGNSSVINVGGDSSSPVFDVTAKDAGGYTIVAGQTLKGSGTVIGVTVLGLGSILAPGGSVGTLRAGDTTMAAGATYEWELGQASADKVDITGNLTLTAGWKLKLVDAGGTPKPGTQYDLFTCTGTVSLGTYTIDAGGTGWNVHDAGVTAAGSRVYITGLALLGDANGDGVVDAADYIALKRNFGLGSGATLAQGDFNNSGSVDWLDLQLLMSSFGAGGGAPATNPEPATLSLLALGGLALIRRRRKQPGLRSSQELTHTGGRMVPILSLVASSLAASSLSWPRRGVVVHRPLAEACTVAPAVVEDRGSQRLATE